MKKNKSKKSGKKSKPASKRTSKASKRMTKARAVPAADKAKPFLIAIITLIAILALLVLLIFSSQFVGKAILAPNTASAELVSPAYADKPFSLKVQINTGAVETTSVQFTLKLPDTLDCTNYLAAAPVKNLIEGWNILENKCSPGKISYFATKDISSPTGKSGSIDVAQIDITKGLALDTNLQFTFESFLALDKN